MIVIRARAMGMCFGVREAIRTAFSQPNPENITIHGSLVHNEEVMRELARRGFAIRSEADRDRLAPTPELLVTAHGISDCERQRLQAAGTRLVDTTCPLVRKIHQAAQALKERGYFVVVLGKPAHVEVLGIVGDLEHYAIIERPSEARCFEADRLGILCQSTMAPDLAERILAVLRVLNAGKEIRYVPTICRPTRERQSAARELLGQVQAVVVVGGRSSNNTLELVRLAEAHDVACLHVQTAEDLRPEWFAGLSVVGLTAGTSTPDALIEAVYQRLLMIQSASNHPDLAQSAA